ncbi:MAG: hypothetical protein JW904_02960 [Spirochaetales bacterium]|nr:hypothetical protein [Spirochaetales bacterium]
MKRFLLVSLCLIAAAIAYSLDIDGNFMTELRISLEDGSYVFNQENGTLAFEHQVDDNLFAMAKLRFRYFNSPLGLQSGSSVLSVSELSVLSAIGPVEISLDEAYFEYTNFLVDGLDISMGKQRIQWGTADVLNPTDILNSLDLSDPFDFGRKIPCIAAMLRYTFPESEAFILGVWEPFSPVARSNPLVAMGIEAGLVQPPAISAVNADSGTVLTPQPELSNSLFAVKAGVPVAGFDFSVNFVTRISDIPLVSAVAVDGFGGNVTSYTLSYYREYEAGIDVVKDWNVLLTWAEVAVFWQDAQTTETDIFGIGISTATALPADPYVKYTVGFDKQFGSFFYLNVQYAHGFFTERGNTGPGRLQDYCMMRFETRLFDDRLVIGLTGLVNVNNMYEAVASDDFFGYIADNYGVLGGLEIVYKPSLSVKLSMGIMLFEGTSTANIGTMKDSDFVYMKAEFFY